jgi:hypothetical protein
MRNLCLLALWAIAVASSRADVLPPPPRPAPVLACTGPFTKAATHASLVKHFGAKNVAWEIVDGPEGSTYGVTAIHPNDPTKRVEVVWQDEEARKNPLSIDVKSETTKWSGPGGVVIGMPIAEVERRNGKPFMLSGFQWDMWGWVLDWKGGKLPAAAKSAGCDNYTVRFDERGDSSKAAGEGPYASNAKAMRKAKPVVHSFGVGFAYPDAAQ